MLASISSMGKERTLAMFADWTTRIAAGELPQAPPRPKGVERNVAGHAVDWAAPKVYLHDEIATDKRNPTVNANGMLYGAPELSTDNVPVSDPVRHTTSTVRMLVRSQDAGPQQAGQNRPSIGATRPFGIARGQHAQPHMFDGKGRIWFTSVIRPTDNPGYCKDGASHPSAKVMPLSRSGRQLAVYDPKTKQVSLIDTCWAARTICNLPRMRTIRSGLTGGGGDVLGWLNTTCGTPPMTSRSRRAGRRSSSTQTATASAMNT